MIWLSFNTLFSLNGKLKFLVPISFLLWFELLKIYN
jgi:hypothetical protein